MVSFLGNWLGLSDMLGMGQEGLTVRFSIPRFQFGKPLGGLRIRTLSDASSFSFAGNLQDEVSLQG